MTKQMSLSMTGYFDKGKKSRREVFLAEMEQALPWARAAVETAAKNQRAARMMPARLIQYSCSAARRTP